MIVLSAKPQAVTTSPIETADTSSQIELAMSCALEAGCSYSIRASGTVSGLNTADCYRAGYRAWPCSHRMPVIAACDNPLAVAGLAGNCSDVVRPNNDSADVRATGLPYPRPFDGSIEIARFVDGTENIAKRIFEPTSAPRNPVAIGWP